LARQLELLVSVLIALLLVAALMVVAEEAVLAVTLTIAAVVVPIQAHPVRFLVVLEARHQCLAMAVMAVPKVAVRVEAARAVAVVTATPVDMQAVEPNSLTAAVAGIPLGQSDT
jgi:hypothetical protein